MVSHGSDRRRLEQRLVAEALVTPQPVPAAKAIVAALLGPDTPAAALTYRDDTPSRHRSRPGWQQRT